MLPTTGHHKNSEGLASRSGIAVNKVQCPWDGKLPGPAPHLLRQKGCVCGRGWYGKSKGINFQLEDE